MKKFKSLLMSTLVLLLLTSVFYAQDTIESIQEKLKQNEMERQELIVKLKEKRDELDRQIRSLEDGNGNSVQPIVNSTPPPSKAETPNVSVGDGLHKFVVKAEPTPQPQTGADTKSKNLATLILENLPQTGNKPKIDITSQSAVISLLLSDRIKVDAAQITEKTDEVRKALLDRTIDDAKSGKATLDMEAVRTDKLVGGNSQSSGTTTLVSKAGIPLIFSLATEYGAAVSSVTGTSTSFQFNPVGLTDFLTRSRRSSTLTQIDAERETGMRKLLRRTSFGLTFDLSRGVKTPMFTGSGEQLSQLSFRYGFLNRREPNAKEFADKTAIFLNDTLRPISEKQMQALSNLLDNKNKFKNAALQKWFEDTNTKLSEIPLNSANGSFNDATVKNSNIRLIEDLVIARLAELPIKELTNTEANKALAEFGIAEMRYKDAKEDYFKKLYTKSSLTFEYFNNRGLNSSDSSDFRMIFGKGLNNGIDFTFNGSLSAYHRSPVVSSTVTANQVAKFSKLRDFSFSGQMDVPLYGVPGFENGVISLAAKYQRMNSGAFVFNNTVFTDIRGDIWVAQAKINLGLGKSGLFLPLSFTYANRPELNREKKSRGNLGFTFDVSSLLEKFLGNSIPR